MKNKIRLSFVFIVFLSIGASFFLGQNNESQNFLLENIEALAADEFNPNIMCVGVGSLDCPYNKDKVEFILNGYSFNLLMP